MRGYATFGSWRKSPELGQCQDRGNCRFFPQKTSYAKGLDSRGASRRHNPAFLLDAGSFLRGKT